MRAKITALLLSGALLAGAQGTATAGQATVMWQNRRLTVTESLQPLTITFKNRIARPIRFRCRFLLDSDWTTARGRLKPLAIFGPAGENRPIVACALTGSTKPT